MCQFKVALSSSPSCGYMDLAWKYSFVLLVSGPRIVFSLQEKIVNDIPLNG